MKSSLEELTLKERLIDKSIEAYILALETINRLTIQYRIETFCYLICNAWELLLKAKIIDNKGTECSIYYKRQKGKQKRSLSLRDCLNQIMQNQTAPIRRNIERIEELRDESVHLVIGHIPRDVIGLFQAGVINYHKRLNEWFGESISDRVSIGMMSIVYDMSPEQSDLTDQRLLRKLGPDAAEFLTGYCAELKQESGQLQGSPEFSIGIEYRLVLTKKSNDADIVLSAGPIDGEPTQMVEVAKDSSTSHPFRQTEVLEQLKEKSMTINRYDIQCINEVHKIKNKREYFYQGKIKGSPSQYSQSFVDWLCERYRQDKNFFCKTRAKAKELKKSKSSSSPTTN